MPQKKTNKNKGKSSTEEKRIFLFKEDEQEYAFVIKALGGSRFLLRLNVTGEEMIGKLRGTMRRRKSANWVGSNAVVLVSLRDYQNKVVDILHVYNDNEVRKLQKKGELADENVVLNDESEAIPEEDIAFDFDEI